MSEALHPTVLNPGVQRVAGVYAEALYAEAEEQHAAEEVRDDLRGVIELSSADEHLRDFFLGGVVGRKARAAALDKAFAGKVHPLVLNFLLVLNDHERGEVLRPVVALYESIIEQRAGKVRAAVSTAVPLPDDQRERLTQQLRQITRREPILDLSVDPDMLGGIIVQVGDWRYDASVRSEVDTIREQLIESSSHEIQVGRDRFGSA